MNLDVMGRGIKYQPLGVCCLQTIYVFCSTRREHVERKFEEWRRVMEERGLKSIGEKTEHLGCNQHQDAEIHLQINTVKIVKSVT